MNAPTDFAQRLAGQPVLLLPSEVATLLRCSEWWIKEQARHRRIPHTRVGGGYRFTEVHVADIISRFEVLPDGEPSAPATVPVRHVRGSQSGAPVTALQARTPRRALRAMAPASVAA